MIYSQKTNCIINSLHYVPRNTPIPVFIVQGEVNIVLVSVECFFFFFWGGACLTDKQGLAYMLKKLSKFIQLIIFTRQYNQISTSYK